MNVMRVKQAQTALGVSNSTFYRLTAAGLVPEPFRVSDNAAALFEHEVVRINRARAAGKSDTEIRALVAELEAARAREAL